MGTTVQQAPIRNAETIAASVFSHSGEFAPVWTDLRLPGRGFDFEFTRSYRSSLADRIGELGRGWSCGIMKRLERDRDDLLYHDGTGQVQRFRPARDGAYASPPGFYGTLAEEEEAFVIRERHGRRLRFSSAKAGGWLQRLEDRNANAIEIVVSDRDVVVVDTLGRRITISIADGLIRELADHAGRHWAYRYDDDARLVEVSEPPTADFPGGTSVRYAYDEVHRLISITDAKGQTYLTNTYDESGRVVAQEHGAGVYKLAYESLNGSGPFRTVCRQKNGSTLVLEHNEAGNVVKRTLGVGRSSFATEDVSEIDGAEIPVTTTSDYNLHSELVRRRFPGGQETRWEYAEGERNPLDQGNLLQITELPQAEVESDQASIVTSVAYESAFQLPTSRTDPRGNTTSYEYDERGNLVATVFAPVSIQPVDGDGARLAPRSQIHRREYAYNSGGQVVRRTDISRAVTEYAYYPADDPGGRGGPSSATSDPDRASGYLARVVRDADGVKMTHEYAYDLFGNVTAVFDGSGNAARLQYNAMGRVESVTGRETGHRIDYKYDASYNEIESAQAFERLVHDPSTRQSTLRSTTLRELTEYNALDNVIGRRIAGGDKVVAESFVRDAAERLVRHVQPLGNVTAYVFDERDLLVEKVSAAETSETSTDRFTYTLNGELRSQTDGNGHTITHDHDGFHRYRGFTDAGGTRKTQSFDESGNVVRVRVSEPGGDKVPLIESSYHFDEWSRPYRMDRAWHDLESGEPLGTSNWSGENGVVSTVVEYAANGLAGKIWSETGNVVAFEYDGAARVTAIGDSTGDRWSFEFDANGNATELRHQGPTDEGTSPEWSLRRAYDSMDRLVSQQANDEPPERFRYDALGTVIGYVAASGLEIHHLLDPLGRRAGHTFALADPAGGELRQEIVRGYEYDDDYRLTAYLDAAGNRTTYDYDALGRQTGIVYPDGSVARVEYDAKGNVVRAVDENGSEIVNRYDEADRLFERRGRAAQADMETLAQYECDGAGRLVAASSPGGAVRRTYDSLSRVLTEAQGERVVRFAHDAAGNLTRLSYPGGDEIRRSYDVRNRVTSVESSAGASATFSYASDGRVTGMTLGKTIVVALAYDPEQRLESIEYRRVADGELLEGFHYRYDATGKMTHEVQTKVGASYGDRYTYDEANRPIRAEYGVADLFDPTSAVESETAYEYFPEGLWKRRVDVDATGRTEEQDAVVDRRNRYVSLGKYSLTYDSSGNCVRKQSSNPGSYVYTYDEEGRISKLECYDAKGRLEYSVEYWYDALGRQVRKVVTDANGVATEYTYVWAGSLLVEEYENGVLVRVYVHGIGSTPVDLSSRLDGRSFSYVFNGRGLASGVVPRDDPNAFAEKYVYDLTGSFFMKEIGGVPVGLPQRDTSRSGLGNTQLSGNTAGSMVVDWTTLLLGGLGGRQLDPTISSVLNSVGSKGHKGAKAEFGDQLQGLLGMLGLGRNVSPPPTQSTGSGFLTNPDMSLYADGADGGSGGPFDFKHATPPAAPESKGGATPKDSRIQFIQDVAGKGFSAGPVEGTVGDLAAGLAKGAGAGWTNPKKDAPAPPAPKLTQGEKDAEEKKKKDEDAQKEKDKKAAKEKEDAAAKEKDEKDKEAKKSIVDPDDKYVDPDAASSSTVTMPSPGEIEAKLNQRKRPVNPDGGAQPSQVDTSSPPPHHSGLDPTVAYFDGDGSTLVVSGTLSSKLTGAPIDHVPGWQPFTPEANPKRGGSTPNTGKPWPN